MPTKPTADVPNDLVPLADAAKMAERSARTIRRWVKQGHLTRWDGPTPDDGGSPVALVSTRDLMTYLAVSGQQPRATSTASTSARVDTQADTGGHEGGGQPDTRGVDTSAAVLLAELRAQVALERLRVELTAAVAERDALRGRVADLEADRDQARQNREQDRAQHRHALAGLRDDARHWRDAARAREAELRAVRAEKGLPWWRRMLGGPVDPPELPGWSVEELPEAK